MPYEQRQDNDEEKYGEKWHRRVDRAVFGNFDDISGLWVDGLLQSLADQRRMEQERNERERSFMQLAVRVGLPLLAVIAVAAVLTAMHAPPALVNAIIRGIH